MNDIVQEIEDHTQNPSQTTPASHETPSIPFRKSFHAVITPIEEASVETSLSHGMMSDSVDEKESIPSPQKKNSLRSEEIDNSRPASRRLNSGEIAHPIQQIERLIGQQVPAHKPRKSVKGDTSRVSQAIQNIQQILLDAQRISQDHHQPIISRSEMTRKIQQAREKRRWKVDENNSGDAISVRGEQSKLLLDSEIQGTSLFSHEGDERDMSHVTSNLSDQKSGSIVAKFRALQTHNILDKLDTQPLPFGTNESLENLRIQATPLGTSGSGQSLQSRSTRGIIHSLDTNPMTKLDDLYSKFYPSSAPLLTTRGNQQQIEEALQIQALARNIQSHQSITNSKLGQLVTSTTENFVPIYMRTGNKGTTSKSAAESGKEGVVNEDDETLLKAYAAVLGLDWDVLPQTQEYFPLVDDTDDHLDMKESLQDLVLNLHNLRQTTPISPHREIQLEDETQGGSEISDTVPYRPNTSSTTQPPSGRLSAPHPPQPTTKIRVIPPEEFVFPHGSSRSNAELLREESESVSSCDDSTTIYSLPSQSPMASQRHSNFRQEQELDDDLREYLRSYDQISRESQVKTSISRNSNHPMKRLVTSHSTSAVVRAARQDLQQNTSPIITSSSTPFLLSASASALAPKQKKRVKSSLGGGKLPALSSNKMEITSLGSNTMTAVKQRTGNNSKQKQMNSMIS